MARPTSPQRAIDESLLAVLVPCKEHPTTIDRASAIVCQLSSFERLQAQALANQPALAYYEGGRIAEMDFQTKLVHAAGRLLYKYPTTAFTAILDPKAFKQVGVYNYDTKNLMITDASALEAWGVQVPKVNPALRAALPIADRMQGF